MSGVENLFTEIYEKSIWNVSQTESKSGDGSTLEQTIKIRTDIENLLIEYEIKSILDVPCGDYNWMKDVKMPEDCNYIGADIVKKLVCENLIKYGNSKTFFIPLDISTSIIPKVDIILCRDCLVHLSFEDSLKAIENFKKSGSKYLLVTTFPKHEENNPNVYVGSEERGLSGWQPLNLERTPFNLKSPILYLNENCTEKGDYSDKSLALWKLSDI